MFNENSVVLTSRYSPVNIRKQVSLVLSLSSFGCFQLSLSWLVFFCAYRFVSVGSVYLLVGFLYSRFVLGAKGIDQIPNYEFWKDFGNLQAVRIFAFCIEYSFFK